MEIKQKGSFKFFRVSLVLIFHFLFTPVFSQTGNHQIDSLSLSLKLVTSDSQKVDLYNQLSKLYCSVDFNKALEYSNKAIELSQKVKLNRRLAEAYNIQGIIYINIGKNNEAVESLNNAIDLHKKNGNQKGVASAYGNLGALYYLTGTYDKSLEYNLKCLKINEDLKDKNGIAITLLNVANIYYIQNNYKLARDYYERCLAINRELGNISGELSALNNVGTIYFAENKTDEALSTYQEIKRIAEKENYKQELAWGLTGMGISYRLKGEFKKAHFYLDESYKLYEQLNNQPKLLENVGNIANLYVKERDFVNGVEYGKKYLERAKSIQAIQHERDAYEFLYESYAGLKDFENAFKYYQQYNALKDTIFNKENIKHINELEAKYESEKKETENKALVQQTKIQSLELSRGKFIFAGVVAFFFLALIFSFLIMRQNKLKAGQRSMQLEQKLLRSQMNPHFIFNSLVAIESFIYKNEPKAAGKYLSDFARLMRLILENSREEFVPLEKEIQTLKYYLELQKLRHEDNFEYKIELPEEIDISEIMIPPMLAQPFIENSIEHGLNGITGMGQIQIRFIIKGEDLVFEVLDNGIGFERSLAIKNQNAVHKSFASAITLERLKILNKRNKKIKLVMEDLVDDLKNIKGAKVTFIIPYYKF
jgi:tetratricopeptide (TPR) repeat protein